MSLVTKSLAWVTTFVFHVHHEPHSQKSPQPIKHNDATTSKGTSVTTMTPTTMVMSHPVVHGPNSQSFEVRFGIFSILHAISPIFIQPFRPPTPFMQELRIEDYIKAYRS